MTWSATDVVIGIIILAVIAVLFYLINDAKNKGVPSCSKTCGSCPHPCHGNNTKKTSEDSK